MLYQVLSDNGNPLDAHFEVNGQTIRFHSRGGTKGHGARNVDYGPALRLILKRLHAASAKVEGVWVDSSQVQNLPLGDRILLSAHDAPLKPDDAFTLISKRMRTVGQAPTAKVSGNNTKKLRIDLSGDLFGPAIAEMVGGLAVKKDLRSLDRLPAHELQKITAEHVWNAVQRLLNGESHNFSPSTDFDLLAEDGTRLPPKAVFGLAASEALGFPVLPKHFSAGKETPCFRILSESGFTIIPKGEHGAPQEISTPPSDLEWSEGKPRLVAHLRRERARGLSQAKKAAFLREHGKLFCERCLMDPVDVYGAPAGEACIEVHHEATQVKDMDLKHITRLADLKCLCANCHRVVHREASDEQADVLAEAG